MSSKTFPKFNGQARQGVEFIINELGNLYIFYLLVTPMGII